MTPSTTALPALLVCLASFFIVGCDTMYPPMICNARPQMVHVSYTLDNGENFNLAIPPNSAVTQRKAGLRCTLIRASNADGGPIGTYAEDVVASHTTIANSNQFWMVGQNGIFLIPPKYLNNWSGHTKEIEADKSNLRSQ